MQHGNYFQDESDEEMHVVAYDAECQFRTQKLLEQYFGGSESKILLQQLLHSVDAALA